MQLKKALMSAVLFGLVFFHLPAIASEFAEFSAFGRIVGGYLDTEEARYEGYDDEVSFSQQSLIAVQGDFSISDTLTVSAQLLAHSGDERQSGAEWLYLSYKPNVSWRFKAGKMRTPFFRYSDVIDVGFAYPWISPPQQVYSSYFFSNYEGVSSTYHFDYKQTHIELEAYFGIHDDEYSFRGRDIRLDVEEIVGLLATANYGNLGFRASYMQSSKFDADIPEIKEFSAILSAAGFQDNANSLSFDGTARGYQLGVNYDSLDYFWAAEWISIRSDVLTVPNVDSYYLSVGYNFDGIQTHVTYAGSNATVKAAQNFIPKGVNPQLDALSFGYDNFIDNLLVDSLKSISVGLRYDFMHNVAAKVEVSFLNGEPGEDAFFTDISTNSFDRKARLYQIGLEWVY